MLTASDWFVDVAQMAPFRAPAYTKHNLVVPPWDGQSYFDLLDVDLKSATDATHILSLVGDFRPTNAWLPSCRRPASAQPLRPQGKEALTFESSLMAPFSQPSFRCKYQVFHRVTTTSSYNVLATSE